MTGTTRRQRWGAAATALAAAVPLALAAAPAAHAAAPVTCGTNAATYALDSAGKLYRQDMPTPLTGGTLAPGAVIDSTWTGYGRVLAGPGATFYGIKSTGLYYSHRTSTGTWDVHHRQISTGFASYRNADSRNKITIDNGGHIWALDSGGLRWYKYDATANNFVAGSAKYVASDWSQYDLITAGDDGVLYGRTSDGKLYRSRYDFTSQRWLEQHVQVGSGGWNDTKEMVSFGGDTLLRITNAGSLRYYRYDEDGHTFPVLDKTEGTTNWSTYTDFAASPNQCRLTTSHTPAATPIHTENFTRGSVTQSAAGSLEYAYSDNNGRLVYGRQSDPSDTNSVQWTTVGGDEGFAGQPSLGRKQDGRVTLTAHNLTGSIWTRNQTAKDNPDWGGWIDLAGAMVAHPTTASMPDGTLVEFAADADGKPWYRIEQRPNVDFMGWEPLSGPAFTGAFTTATVRNGIQLFGLDASGAVQTALFNGTSVSAWTSLGGSGLNGSPAVVVNPGYRLRLFVRDADGHIVTKAQSAEGGAYDADWTQVGDQIAAGSPAATLSPTTGSIEIVVRGTDSLIHSTGEAIQGSGTWRDWETPTPTETATDPTVLNYSTANGQIWGYSFRTTTNQVWLFSTSTTGFAARAKTAQGSAAPETGAPVRAPAFTGHALPAAPQE
ncbi:tachylectin-related carbohydrate-binding protein [Actinacidiphila alni]|uniref:tachylectin-related carbohydrate-binding protein n=1 Tax=Actinacidiphila alni TaxID=380248 RepID=UPI003453468E